MCKGWPPFLSFLNEELNYSMHRGEPTLGYEVFDIDLSPWKLRLSDRTPIIWLKRSDLEGSSPRHVVQSVQDVIRERNLDRQTLLVLVDGDSTPLLRYTASPLHNLVVIGADEQEKIRQSRRPSGELLDLISTQVPISNLAPYETRAPVTGSRFFGREYEMSKILGNRDTNYAVLGIRRIGKTSLLREVERILKEDEHSPHVVYLDCSDLSSTDDYVREVVRKLNIKELPRLHLQKYAFFFPDFLERMGRMYKNRIIFLLDEIDNLVIRQRGNWELFSMLRASANKGACQYVIAGFREAMLEQYLLDSPFYNFAQEIRLNEFTRRQAHDLILIPMENLRVRFKNEDEIVGRIYEETAGHPNLVQHYCMILLNRLDQTGEREISPASLIDVYSDEGFKSHLLTSFMQNTRNREKALVYALLAGAGEGRLRGFSQAYMDAALRKRGVVLPQDDIDGACNILVLAGVFHRKGKDYSFTSPVFAKVFQQAYDLEYLLSKAKEEGI
jgi:hypothetical protein